MEVEQLPSAPHTLRPSLQVVLGSVTITVGQLIEEDGHLASLIQVVELRQTLLGAYLHLLVQQGPGITNSSKISTQVSINSH